MDIASGRPVEVIGINAVVMDEAVELARRYGSDASPAFVNGILDALAGDLRPDANRTGDAR